MNLFTLRKRNKPASLSTYYIYRTALAMILLFGVLLFITLFIFQKNTREQFLSLQQSATRILAEELRVRGMSLRVALQTTAEYWASGTFDTPLSEGFQSFGRAVIQSEPSFLSLWIVDGVTFRVKGVIPMEKSILGYDCSYILSAQTPSTRTMGGKPPFFESQGIHGSVSVRPIQWSSIGLNPFFPDPVFSLSMEAGKDFCIGWVNPQLFLQNFTLPKFSELEYLDFFACDGEGNLVVHPEPRWVIRRENLRSIPAIRETLEKRIPSLSILEASIFGAGSMIVTTAPVDEPRWVVGVVQEEQKTRIPPLVLLTWGMFFLATFSLLALFITRQVSRALEIEFQPFSESLQAISKGNYSLQIPPQRFQELESLRNSFQSMVKAIQEREQQLAESKIELERRVQERTEDLQKANEELRNVLTNLSRTQERLLQAEKLSVLGRLSAGVAHELNTPLGAILSSVHSLGQLMEHLIEKELPYFCSLTEGEREFYLWVFKTVRSSPGITSLSTEEEISRLTHQLREAEVHDPEEAAELLADLSPSLSSYLEIFIPILKDPHKRELLHHVSQCLNMFRSLLVIQLAAQKASSVVQALRRYLKSEPQVERGIVEVEQDIETVLVLLQNRIKDGVRVVRKYEGVHAWGSSAQLTQVWLNLINNALQAMNYQGELIIETRQEGAHVSVSIIDNGPGIPEEIKPFIFEPFFTTKKREEGMGIGLEICRTIVREHGGSISFESTPGHTRFTVTLAAFDPGVPPRTS